jgi:histidyl-tRNA synthetase
MKPSVPKGTRDFGPDQVLKRNFIFDTIKRVFVKYGYQPIETPTMENLSTLTGKYGEEGDKLLFKVLNNGDYLAKADQDALDAKDSAKLTASISKRGLRYDLTVPFARFVVMHQNDISFPFKRYQIQPVWRADRPQKGRYQEFYQCDVDVVGSESLVYEAELVQIYDEVFAELGIEVVIKLNNRKVLAGIAEVAGISDKMVDMTVAIDKLDKIGMDGVKQEMDKRGISASAIEKIDSILAVSDLAKLKDLLSDSEIGSKGVEELETFYTYFNTAQPKNKVSFDITLARGLSYYTGCIFEVAVDTSVESQQAVKMGSIGGGGRYDDLTSIFGMKGVSGVGVSFGAARIFDVMEELNLFPKENAANLKALFIAFDQTTHAYAFSALTKLRQAGVNADIYPDPVKMKKQMKYANDRQVPYVVLAGSQEMESGQLTLKNMESGEQEKLSIEDIISKLK